MNELSLQRDKNLADLEKLLESKAPVEYVDTLGSGNRYIIKGSLYTTKNKKGVLIKGVFNIHRPSLGYIEIQIQNVSSVDVKKRKIFT